MQNVFSENEKFYQQYHASSDFRKQKTMVVQFNKLALPQPS